MAINTFSIRIFPPKGERFTVKWCRQKRALAKSAWMSVRQRRSHLSQCRECERDSRHRHPKDSARRWPRRSPRRRPPDAVAVRLGWRDGATSYQAFARMSECMSGLHFDQIEGHFPLLFFPIRAKKREIFQCFYESSYSETIKWASKQILFKSLLFTVSKYVFNSEYYRTRRNFALRQK